MTFVRIRLSVATSNRLKSLKGRTGLTPNVLCRLALCYSLADSHPLGPAVPDSDGLELNRATLFGEREEVYLALLKQRMVNDAVGHELEDTLRAHIDRGVALLAPRLKSVADVTELLSEGGVA